MAEHAEKGASRASQEAMHEMDEHQAKRDTDEIPAADAGGHDRSHVAHRDKPTHPEHTKPEGDLRHGPDSTERPPREPRR